MNKPLMNFLFSFLVPAACIYFFAYQSLTTIETLKREKAVLVASATDTAGQTPTVANTPTVIHDTIVVVRHDTILEPATPIPGEPVVTTQYVYVHDTIRIATTDPKIENILRDSLRKFTNEKSILKENFSSIMNRWKAESGKLRRDTCRLYRPAETALTRANRLVGNY